MFEGCSWFKSVAVVLNRNQTDLKAKTSCFTPNVFWREMHQVHAGKRVRLPLLVHTTIFQSVLSEEAKIIQMLKEPTQKQNGIKKGQSFWYLIVSWREIYIFLGQLMKKNNSGKNRTSGSFNRQSNHQRSCLHTKWGGAMMQAQSPAPSGFLHGTLFDKILVINVLFSPWISHEPEPALLSQSCSRHHEQIYSDLNFLWPFVSPVGSMLVLLQHENYKLRLLIWKRILLIHKTSYVWFKHVLFSPTVCFVFSQVKSNNVHLKVRKESRGGPKGLNTGSVSQNLICGSGVAWSFKGHTFNFNITITSSGSPPDLLITWVHSSSRDVTADVQPSAASENLWSAHCHSVDEPLQLLMKRLWNWSTDVFPLHAVLHWVIMW